MMSSTYAQLIHIPVDDVHIEGMLEAPAGAQALVLFAHGSGSSRHDPHNKALTVALHDAGIGTLLLDLLTVAEELDYHTQFDIALHTHRMLLVTGWIKLNQHTRAQKLGYFGVNTGAATALQAAAALGEDIAAVVCRGGRCDLAGHHDLRKVVAPTLLLVGAGDEEILRLNQHACAQLTGRKSLSIIPGATHLFEEPGALALVAQQSTQWFCQHLKI